MALSLWRSCLLLLAACLPLFTAEPLAPARVLPPAMAEAVDAVVRVENPAWVFEQAGSLLPEGGGAVATVPVCEYLFTCRDPAMIDGSRPAVVAWRGADRSMIAIIPVTERQGFIEAFGSPRTVKRMLLRTGERDGTVIYRQASPQGIREYRLLLRDGYAYLAASKEECEALAERPLEVDADAPPLAVEWRGGFLADHLGAQPDLSDLATGPMTWSVDGPLTEAWELSRGLLTQIHRLRLTVSGDDQGALAITADLEAHSDTALAAWIGRQSNSQSRLLPLVGGDQDLLAVHGEIRWQDEPQRVGKLFAELLRANPEITLDDETEQDLRDYFALASRQGAFAMAMAMTPEGRSNVVRIVHEQPRAGDYLTLQRSLGGIFRSESRTGEFEAIADHLAYRSERMDAKGLPSHSITAAVGDHIVEIQAPDPELALAELQALIADLEEPYEPMGASGVIALRLSLHHLLDAMADFLGHDEGGPEPLVIDCAVRVQRGGGLRAEAALPLLRIRDALAQLMAFDGP